MNILIVLAVVAVFAVLRFLRANLHLLVSFTSSVQRRDHFVRRKVVVAGADLGEGFIGLKPAARAAANVVGAEQCALRAGKLLHQFSHRHRGFDRHD